MNVTAATDLPATAPAPMSPLIERLVERHGATWVDAARVEAWAGGPGDRVLFFSGDPVRFPECLDVAVVLPELQAAYPGRLSVGVVRREDEDALARRYGSQRWPALVFLREGRYVATIAGMHDWDDYLRLVRDALAAPATRAPTIGIAVVAADAPASACR
jgi:hydrogenase-1 operon protein HyaE